METVLKKVNFASFILILFFSFGFFLKERQRKKQLLVDYDQSHYLQQVYSPITNFQYKEDKRGVSTYYKIQRSHDNSLYFGPNEVFFNPAGEMRAKGVRKTNKKLDFNKGWEFHYATNFVVTGG